MTAQSDDDFWSKVVKGLPDECWEWSGYRRPNKGYAAYGGPQDDLAALFGVTQGTISRIKSRVRQGAVQ